MKWRNLQPSGYPGAIGYVSTWNYDVANDVGVLVRYRMEDKNQNAVWIYDPDKNSWSKTANPIPGWNENGNGFYDPVLNVHFFHNARDNSVGGMWAYRYKKASKTK
jgi:hypothetical protein